MKNFVFAAVLVLSSAIFADAQVVVPTIYRVTRTASGQATITPTFQKSAMTCNLAVAVPAAGHLRITDPELTTRDCDWVDTAGALFVGMVREVEYTFTIAGQHNAIDGYGPESAAVRITLPRIPQIPGAPLNPRIVPPTSLTVSVLGTVESRGFAFGLDVATNSLDGIPNFPFYFGASSLVTGGEYGSPRNGDRFFLQLWRP